MITITRLNVEVLEGDTIVEDNLSVELDCEYGTFTLFGGELYVLGTDEDEDWEPIDWDIVEEDDGEYEDHKDIERALKAAIVGAKGGVK